MTQLDRLCELDPEHFLFKDEDPACRWRKHPDSCWFFVYDITWEIAGWMREQMRERYVYFFDKTPPDSTLELRALTTAMDTRLYSANPEYITQLYLGWKASSKPVDAPAASGQELRPQAPANTHETDH